MAKKAPPAFPLYGDLSEKKMRALGEKLDKLQDPNGFKHYDLLAKHADGAQSAAAVAPGALRAGGARGAICGALLPARGDHPGGT